MSTAPSNARTAARALVDGLRLHGVDTVFCVPGESYLSVLDALHDARDAIRTITCRHEGGAANMAEAYGKLTGRPGVLMVTRGPGACHASIGLHTARQDSTPMVVLIGQIPREQEYREAFQEIDYHAFYGPLCKWVGQLDRPERAPELLSQAFHRATAGRPGPVALALPEDALDEPIAAPDAGGYTRVDPEPSPEAMREFRTLLAGAQRPLAIVGGGGWSEAACADLARFAEANRLAVAASFRCQDRIDNEHPRYAGALGLGGDPALAARVRESDLLIAIGARLGSMTTGGYTLVEAPRPRQRLVHVYPDPDELGRVFQCTLPIVSGPGGFARAAAAMEPVDAGAWDAWSAAAHADWAAYATARAELPGPLDMGAVMATLRERLAPDAILTTDAGNFSAWMHRHYVYRRFPTQIGPTSGAMAYGVPAAIAARLVHPDRTVVGFCGDGGALMSGQEIATALHHGIDPIVLVVNNGMYGTIRMHQEREYPGRVHATGLTNPDFTAWARSFGAFAARVERTEAFAPALEEALGAGRVAVIELVLDPEVITTHTTLSGIREQAAARSG